MPKSSVIYNINIDISIYFIFSEILLRKVKITILALTLLIFMLILYILNKHTLSKFNVQSLKGKFFLQSENFKYSTKDLKTVLFLEVKI